MPKATRRWTAPEVERLRYEPRTALGLHNKGAAQVVCQAEPKPRQSRAKKPAGPRISEHAEQVAVIQWWTMFHGTVGLDERLLFMIPNAQKFMSKARNPHAAYKHAVAEGLRDGAPDLILALPSKDFHGMFLEMKALNGKLGIDQSGMIFLLREMGYNCVIAYGADEAIRAIEAYVRRALP